jgi:hypothetical protein
MDKEKAISFDEVFSQNSLRTSKDFGGSSGFLGCDSDGGDRVGHPLPLPSPPLVSPQTHLRAFSASPSPLARRSDRSFSSFLGTVDESIGANGTVEGTHQLAFLLVTTPPTRDH